MLRLKLHQVSMLALMISISPTFATEKAHTPPNATSAQKHLEIKLLNPVTTFACPTTSQVKEALAHKDKEWKSPEGITWKALSFGEPKDGSLGLLQVSVRDWSSRYSGGRTAIVCRYINSNSMGMAFAFAFIPDVKGAFNIDSSRCKIEQNAHDQHVVSESEKNPAHSNTVFMSKALADEAKAAENSKDPNPSDLTKIFAIPNLTLPEGLKIKCEKTQDPPRRLAALEREHQEDLKHGDDRSPGQEALDDVFGLLFG